MEVDHRGACILKGAEPVDARNHSKWNFHPQAKDHPQELFEDSVQNEIILPSKERPVATAPITLGKILKKVVNAEKQKTS